MGFGFDGSAAALFAAMATAPSNARKTAYNTFIRSLKSAGVWPKLDAIYLFAAHASAAALINVKNPGTYNATAVNSPTFTTDRGYAGDGATSYVDSNFNPSSAGGNFMQDSACFGIRNLSTGQSINALAGFSDGTDGITVNPRNANDDPAIRIAQASASSQTTTMSSAAVFIMANRSGANATELYINGAEVAVDVNADQASTTLNDNTLYFGRTGAATYATAQIASGYIGGSLSAAEHAALRAADLAYMQAVGAA